MADYSGADATVQATNDSSIVSKASAAALGYFEDSNLCHVAARGPKGRLIRRSPLVNRCYYMRHLGIVQLQDSFLNSCISPGEPYNIVVLGAGFDTGALRRQWHKGLAGYYEIDFPAVLARKQALLARASVQLPAWLHRCGADLRDTQEVESSLRSKGVDFNLPTLLLAEVVLAYMEPSEGDALAAWVARTFPNCLFGMYEQIGPHDQFGRFMRRHFLQRQCPLRALLTRPDLKAQRARFECFPRVHAADMMAVLAATSQEELHRAAALEPFDEHEELHLKCAHYFCLAALAGRCANSFVPIWAAAENCDEAEARRSGAVRAAVVSRIPSLRVPRFGLASAILHPWIIACGGHGTTYDEKAETHGRQPSLICFNLDSLRPTRNSLGQASQPLEAGQHAAAMYCSITIVGERGFVFGGRMGPSRPSAALSIVSLEENKQPQLRQHESSQDCPWPPARWRHSATPLQVEGTTPQVLILGGLSEVCQVLNLRDAWLLRTDTLTWQSIDVSSAEADGSIPCPRHSHAATALPEGKVMVCGGLNADEQLLGDAWLLESSGDGATMKLAWRRVSSPLPQPRYGHQLHAWQGHLVVVGGIDGTYTAPEICVDGSAVSLKSSAGNEEDEDLFMWHNASSAILSDAGWRGKPSLLVVGGGGNCFSFGTHLNRDARLVPLGPLIGQSSASECCAGIRDCTCM